MSLDRDLLQHLRRAVGLEPLVVIEEPATTATDLPLLSARPVLAYRPGGHEIGPVVLWRDEGEWD